MFIAGIIVAVVGLGLFVASIGCRDSEELIVCNAIGSVAMIAGCVMAVAA